MNVTCVFRSHTRRLMIKCSQIPTMVSNMMIHDFCWQAIATYKSNIAHSSIYPNHIDDWIWPFLFSELLHKKNNTSKANSTIFGRKKSKKNNKQTQLYQEATAMKCTLKACLLGDWPTKQMKFAANEIDMIVIFYVCFIWWFPFIQLHWWAGAVSFCYLYMLRIRTAQHSTTQITALYEFIRGICFCDLWTYFPNQVVFNRARHIIQRARNTPCRLRKDSNIYIEI